MSRAATLEELEAEPTLRHLAWHAAMVLAANNKLENRGLVWGEQEEGQIQGDPEASAWFGVGLHRDVRQLDAEVSVGGGFARFGNDDGYVCGPPEFVFPAVTRFEERIKVRCGVQLQREKTEIFSWGVVPAGAPVQMRRAGEQVEGGFEPGFLCYGIPVGSPGYCRYMLNQKAVEVVKAVEDVCRVLGEEKQSLWLVLHRSLQHKRDYHLALCYPSDIVPTAAYLDNIMWGVMERCVDQKIPRREEGAGFECVQ